MRARGKLVRLNRFDYAEWVDTTLHELNYYDTSAV